MIPLSEKLRPSSFEQIQGQEEVTSWIKHRIDIQKPLSFLLYGPPGSGKTTLARLFGKSFQNARFLNLSAVSSKIQDVKKFLSENFFNQKTLLFVDEIHRFNKAQQDIFLPYMENGDLILIAATTENPSFCLNNALLSRLRVLKLEPLDKNNLQNILLQYETQTNHLIPKPIQDTLIQFANGDARHLFNLIENLEGIDLKNKNIKDLQKHLQKRSALYDKDRDAHYNLISALHKSIRGSDADAALYWLCRILEAGEDPLYVSRRLIRASVEDIGLADPQALQIALNSFKMYQILGSPEGEIALAQTVLYLALAPKSNRLYVAMKKAQKSAEKTHHLDPPMHVLNAPTPLMKEMGYSKGYIYDHDTDIGFSGQNAFPDSMPREPFYIPVARGFERELQKRCSYFENLRKKFTAS